MSDQTWAMLVGFAVVVGMRLLDWAFPKGMVWKKIREWSVSKEDLEDDDDS